ncbi:MAG: transposase, partial [Caedimonas sp.]|nr:transposase [Caedimonas sp.]
ISQVKDPTSLSSVEDLFKTLKKSLIERLLETEMTHHLGYAKHSKREGGGLNYRNGHTSKTVLAGEDEVDIQTPRDRESTFQPVYATTKMKLFDVYVITSGNHLDYWFLRSLSFSWALRSPNNVACS